MEPAVAAHPLKMRWLFESHLPRRAADRPELLAAARGSFRFVVEGEEAGSWLLELRDGPATVVPGGNGGQCTVAASALTLAGIASGRINPRLAWEDGRLRAEGEIQPPMLAALLQLLQVDAEEEPAAAAGGQLVVATARERPDLLPMARAIAAGAQPEFMLHNPVANLYWQETYAAFPDLQFVLHDAVTEEVVAMGISTALAWDFAIEGWPDGGWDWAIARAIADHRAGRKPNAQCGLFIAIAPRHRGKGLSTTMVKAMKALGQRHRFEVLVIPVRPTQKSAHPLIPIERYVTWLRGDGRPFDSWLRSHTTAGGEIIGPCRRSTLIEASVREWEEWTGLRFPDSGSYVVPGALVPLEVDRPHDRGVYLEPNVWVRHPMSR